MATRLTKKQCIAPVNIIINQVKTELRPAEDRQTSSVYLLPRTKHCLFGNKVRRSVADIQRSERPSTAKTAEKVNEFAEATI